MQQREIWRECHLSFIVELVKRLHALKCCLSGFKKGRKCNQRARTKEINTMARSLERANDEYLLRLFSGARCRKVYSTQFKIRECDISYLFFFTSYDCQYVELSFAGQVPWKNQIDTD